MGLIMKNFVFLFTLLFIPISLFGQTAVNTNSAQRLFNKSLYNPFIGTTNANNVPLMLQGVANQVTNLLEIKNSAGTIVGSVNSNGNFYIIGKITVNTNQGTREIEAYNSPGVTGVVGFTAGNRDGHILDWLSTGSNHVYGANRWLALDRTTSSLADVGIGQLFMHRHFFYSDVATPIGIRPTNSNAMKLHLVPNGDQSGIGQNLAIAGVKFFGTDFYTDTANYFDFGIYTTWDDLRFNSKGYGTIPARPFVWSWMDVNTIMTLATNGNLTVAGKYYGDGSGLTNIVSSVSISTNGQSFSLVTNLTFIKATGYTNNNGNVSIEYSSEWNSLSTNALTTKLASNVWQASWGALSTNIFAQYATTNVVDAMVQAALTNGSLDLNVNNIYLTNPLDVPNGGTGGTNWVVGGILFGDGTNKFYQLPAALSAVLSNAANGGIIFTSIVAGANVSVSIDGGTATISATGEGGGIVTGVASTQFDITGGNLHIKSSAALTNPVVRGLIVRDVAQFNDSDGSATARFQSADVVNTNLNIILPPEPRSGVWIGELSNETNLTTRFTNDLTINSLRANESITVLGTSSGYIGLKSSGDTNKIARIFAPATINTNINVILPPEGRDGVWVGSLSQDTNVTTRFTNNLTGLVTGFQSSIINTNLGYAPAVTLSMHENTIGSVTNAMTGDMSVLVTNVVPGKSLSFEFLADTSDRTVNFFWPVGTIVATYTTNGAPAITNMLVKANEKNKVVFESPWTNRVSKITGRSQWLNTY